MSCKCVAERYLVHMRQANPVRDGSRARTSILNELKGEFFGKLLAKVTAAAQTRW
jgi:hypothetical protein